ncbi:pleurocidin-like peptide WF3 isoform X2 [Gambusia affinis]|uniref:pleurocidin-like peptide WF3 isoform X2 n=1 Tax=Gambusia affinis TaxID=33528 RepID=UPI001CDD89A1|nr:pleurocidin-like peptide WF3 isoform X2 [Gambusia affinis]
MKLAVVFLVLSMVVLMAEPGEGFLGDLAINTLGKCAKGILGKKQAVEQAEQQLDQQQLDQQELDQQQLDQQQLDQQELDQQQLDQQQLDQLQMQKRSFLKHKALQRH